MSCASVLSFNLLHDPAALAADPAAAHEEHLNGRLQVVLSVGEQVSIHGRAEHHGVSQLLVGRNHIVTKNRGAQSPYQRRPSFLRSAGR